jgi:nitroimidazol reductase NimA-like FMN-containing flavoprotein (pyridoxamine 5'-phosphate oxidase superfamily)
MRTDVSPGFDLDGFLQRPLVARLATLSPDGPRVRPIWYLFDESGFWWITGRWSRLAEVLRRDSRVEVVVDTCDLERGEVLQVRARGRAKLLPFDRQRAQTWGERYMGSDRTRWGRFQRTVFEDPASQFALLQPDWLWARDLSWRRPD